MSSFDIIQRQRILNKTNGLCAHCGKEISLKTFTIDHYIPKSKGGKSTQDNLIPLCWECNQEKSNEVYEPLKVYPYINIEYENQLEELFYRYCKAQKAKDVEECDIEKSKKLNNLRHNANNESM